MYILLTGKSTVAEIIPDENPIFPGVPVNERYAPDFVSRLMHVPDNTPVDQNWLYDPETGVFSEPIPEMSTDVEETAEESAPLEETEQTMNPGPGTEEA